MFNLSADSFSSTYCVDAASDTAPAEPAICHQMTTTKSLHDALSTPPKSRNEQDTRSAAALALLLPPSHLQNGLTEFLTMVRGCSLIASDTDESTSPVNPMPSITTVSRAITILRFSVSMLKLMGFQ